jgi:hypothetical protein
VIADASLNTLIKNESGYVAKIVKALDITIAKLVEEKK